MAAARHGRWPFVIYSVVCYGLLVRGLLLTYALWQLRRSVGAVGFDHAEANALLRRLTGPMIRTDGAGPELKIPGASDGPPTRAGSARAGRRRR